jgi:hypothetical protein
MHRWFYQEKRLETRWIRISTSAAVLSSIFLILILPFVVCFQDAVDQRRRIGRKRDLRNRQAYFYQLADLRTHANPAAAHAVIIIGNVGNPRRFENREISGKVFPFNILIEASMSSLKLCGSTFVESPTAIPSAPCAKSNGNFTGRLFGSLRLPS